MDYGLYGAVFLADSEFEIGSGIGSMELSAYRPPKTAFSSIVK